MDWLSPAGLATWGDGRRIIIGTDGYMEIREYIDLAGRDGGSHLFLVDKKGTRHLDCRTVELPFARQFIADVLDRTETAMTQSHSLGAMELALRAQALAEASH